MKIAKDIFLLKHPCGTAWSGIYLIVREKTVVIDTAFEPAMESLLGPALAENGKTFEDIDYVFFTHLHGDHTGGTRFLRTHSFAKFAVHESGVLKMRDPEPYLTGIRKRFSPPLPYSAPKVDFYQTTPDVVLHEGDTVAGLRIVHTPGHDTECISIFDPETGILFTGDSLQGIGTRSAGLAFYQDLAAYRSSIEKIRFLRPETLAMGHPFAPSDGVVRDVPAFLNLCMEKTNEYDRELRSLLPGDVFSLTPELVRRCGITPEPTVPVLAFHTVQTHLENIKK